MLCSKEDFLHKGEVDFELNAALESLLVVVGYLNAKLSSENNLFEQVIGKGDLCESNNDDFFMDDMPPTRSVELLMLDWTILSDRLYGDFGLISELNKRATDISIGRNQYLMAVYRVAPAASHRAGELRPSKINTDSLHDAAV